MLSQAGQERGLSGKEDSSVSRQPPVAVDNVNSFLCHTITSSERGEEDNGGREGGKVGNINWAFVGAKT